MINSSNVRLHILPLSSLKKLTNNMKNNNTMNILMMSWVAGYLPHPQYQAFLCSSGSKGYSAFRRSLEPGYPEHTILLTNVDIRDMQQLQHDDNDNENVPDDEQDTLQPVKDGASTTTSSLFSGIVRVALSPRQSFGALSNPPSKTISTWLSRSVHVCVFGNITTLPCLFLAGCDHRTSIDFSGLQGCVTMLGNGFLENCSSLTELNFSGLENLKMLPSVFLSGCSGIKSISFRGLMMGGCSTNHNNNNNNNNCGGNGKYSSKIKTLPSSFLRGNTTLESIDLTGLENVRYIPSAFLAGCSGLTTIDLSPLHLVTEIPMGFLHNCSNLTSIIFPKSYEFSCIPPMFLFGCKRLETVDLALFRNVPRGECPKDFLTGCTAMTTINNPPPFTAIPSGWILKKDDDGSNPNHSSWVRERTSNLVVNVG